MYYLKRFLMLLVLFTIAATTVQAENLKSITQVDLIFDASGSMWGKIDGVAKIDIARKAVRGLMKDFEGKKDIQLALRIYGHQNKKCDNSVLEIPMGQGNHAHIIKKIDQVKPLGKTPIAYSLQESVSDFKKEIPGDKIVVVITDGLESCNQQICDVSKQLKAAGIHTKIHVVGFGMKAGDIESLKCIVEPFEGKVIGAANTKELIGAFKKITREVTEDKNLKVMGFDKNNQPVYMNLDIYRGGGKYKYNEGSVVSFFLEEGVYDIHAKSHNSGMKLKKNSIRIEKNKKSVVKLIFADARLKLKTLDDKGQSVYVNYAIYESGTENKVAGTEGSGVQEVIVPPGTYDIKVYEYNAQLTQWKKNIQVGSGELVEKIFKLEMGKLNLKTVNAKKESLYVNYAIYESGTENKVAGTEGSGVQNVVVPPGVYDIKIYEYNASLTQWARNIKIKPGDVLEKVFILGK